MEYHPDIFIHRGIPLLTSGDLTRKAYLSPKRSLLQSALMKDIVELTVQLKPVAISAFATLLSALNYTETQEPGAILYCGPGVGIRLITGDTDAKYSIKAIKTSLTHIVKEPIEFAFGSKATLRLHEDTAEWSFGL